MYTVYTYAAINTVLQRIPPRFEAGASLVCGHPESAL